MRRRIQRKSGVLIPCREAATPRSAAGALREVQTGVPGAKSSHGRAVSALGSAEQQAELDLTLDVLSKSKKGSFVRHVRAAARSGPRGAARPAGRSGASEERACARPPRAGSASCGLLPYAIAAS